MLHYVLYLVLLFFVLVPELLKLRLQFLPGLRELRLQSLPDLLKLRRYWLPWLLMLDLLFCVLDWVIRLLLRGRFELLLFLLLSQF